MKRVGSQQRKTRHKFRQYYKQKGKVPLSRYFQELKDGDIVHLKVNPGVIFGRFYRRFHGFSGVIEGQRGSCYRVLIKDGDKEKRVYVHPIHLQKA